MRWRKLGNGKGGMRMNGMEWDGMWDGGKRGRREGRRRTRGAYAILDLLEKTSHRDEGRDEVVMKYG